MISATTPRTVSARIRHLYLAIAFGLIIGMMPIGFGLDAARAATSFVVNSTADVVDLTPGDGSCDTGNVVGPDPECTLRAAVQEANALPGSDTITVPAGTFVLSLGTGSENAAAEGDLDITDQVTITGAGAGATVIDGNGSDRSFETVGTVTASISGLTITNGFASGNGSGIYIGANTTLTLDGVLLTGNSQTPSLHNAGSLTIANSRISGNASAGNGGGISTNGPLIITDSVIDGNTAASDGGGLFISGIGASATLTNVTISGNTAGNGGGISNGKSATLTNVTVTNNTVTGNGGGLFEGAGSVATTLLNTIVAGNTAGSSPDIDGSISSSGFNLIGDSTGSTGWVGSDRLNVDPLLGALADNGGATPTHALSAGSEAIDNGTTVGAPTADQRGVTRDANPDIGAYEYEPNNPPVAVDDTDSTLADTPVVIDVLANDSDPDTDPLTVGSVTQGTNGSVVNNGSDVTYTPNASWTGTDTFTYAATDGNGGSDTATVTVTVTLDPVVLDDIQKGTATLSGGSASVTATITSVDPSKSFLVFNVRENTGSPQDGHVTGQLTNATTVTFQRLSTTGTVTIEWSVVEFVSGVAVQRGSAALAGTTTTIPITSVDLTRSFPLVSQRVAGAAFTDDDFIRAGFGSSTSLELKVDQVNVTSHDVEWQVVQYNDSAVQSGTVSFTASQTTATATVSAVDTSKAWLVYGYQNAPGAAPYDDIGQRLVRGLVTDSTTLTFDRANTEQTIDLTYHLIEFTDTTEVQHANASFASAEATKDVTITTVDPSRAISAGGYLQTGGRSAYAANDNPGVAWFTTRITSGTNLRIQRDAALATANLGWFVVHWPGPNNPPVAVDDTDSTSQDTPVVIDVLANDSDVDGDPMAVDSVTQGSNGAVTNNGTDVTYTPNASWTGTDTFTYTVTDGTSTDTATVTVTVAALEPVVLDDIQTGTAVIAGGASSTTATITAVDPSRSFLTFSVRGDQASAADMWVTGDLTNSTTVTFQREGTTGTVTIEWSVVEFASGVTVQRGSTIMSGTTTDVPITPSDLSRSFVVATHRVAGTNIGANDLVAASLTSSTNLRLTMNSFFGVDVEWQVVRYNDSSVQSGSVTFGTTTSSTTATVSALDPAKTWLLYSARTDDGTGSNIGQKLVRGQVTDATTLTFDRSATGQAMVVEWFAVEFTDDAVSQRGNAAFGSITGTVDSPITAVDTARSIAVGGYLQYGGRTAYTTATNPGYGWGTATLTSSTNVRVQRDATGATADIPWQVIEWPAPNTAPVASDDSATTNEDTAVIVAVLANDSDGDGDTLSVSSVTQPSNGSVTNNGTNVTYTPTGNYNGPDSFTYTVSDGNGGTDTATVTVTVTAVNDAPVAVDDSASTNEDTAVIVAVLANDSDAEGDTVSIDSFSQGSNGSVVDNGDGTLTYTPSSDFNGADTFTYAATDGTDASNVATVTVTVSTVNDAPVAVDDSASTNEDTAVIIDLIGNDIEVDGDALSLVSVSDGTNGSVVDNGDGTVTYTPNPNTFGSDSFTYSVTDGTVPSNVATVTVTVTPVNDPPVASGDSDTTAEETAIVIDLVANDTDPEGDSLLVGAFTQGSGGAVVDNGDGSVTYTPNLDYNGTDSFTYSATDGTDSSNTVTVWVTVTPVNDTPVAVDDSVSTAEDTAVIVSVLANDTDVDGDTLSIGSFTQPTNGTVTDNGDGTLTYTPDPDYAGSDGFTYVADDGTVLSNTATVSVTVTAVNDVPVAADDAVTTDEDTAAIVAVLANDADPEGDTLSIDSFTQPANGTVTDNGDGTLTYTPDPDYFGPDSFTYVATDGTDTSSSATVNVTVTSVNDVPVANDDSATTNEDTSIVIDLIGNDTDLEGDALSIQGIGQPSNGTVINNGDGTVTYTPDPDFSGSDPFTYSVTDGADPSNVATVGVTVNAVADAPVANGDSATTNEDTAAVVSVLANDTDADGDALSIDSFTQGSNGTVTDNGDGTLTYAPNADFNGTDSFTYVASDGTAASNTATVTITIDAVNDAPVAVDDSTSTNEDAAVVIDVIANDTDADSDSLLVGTFGQGSNGTVSDNGDGTVTYTPNADFNGTDSFTYSATDGTDTSNTATVTVTVNALNDPPIAAGDSASTSEDTAVVIDVLTNDTDADGDPLTVVAVTQGSNGTVADNGDGTVTYTPDPDFNGSDSFTYTVSDGNGGDVVSPPVSVTVLPFNDAPVANDDAGFTTEDTPVAIDLIANDSDVDGDGLSIVGLSNGANGSVTDNGDGTVTYTPNADFTGTDTITYSVTDGTVNSNAATVTITVNAVNDAPVAVDDSASTNEDTAVVIDVVSNDTDAEGDSLLVDVFSQGSNGTVADNGDGTVTYTSNADFNGTDTFTYSVTDGADTSNTATVTVTVTAINDAPLANDDSATTDEDAAVVIDLIGNDTDTEGDSLTFVSVSNGANGTVSDNGDGTVTYTPNADFNGTDTFVYSVTDGADNSNIATVTVTVNPLDDTPVAVDDTASTPEDTAVVIDVVANDTDVDGDSLLVGTLGAASSGSVVDNGDGTVTFTPAADFVGVATFTYSATDGALTSNAATVTVTVNAVNDAPLAVDDAAGTAEDNAVTVDVIANDTDPDGDALSVASVTQPANGTVVDNGDGTVTYTPDADFNGTDTFTYVATDGTATSSAATVTFTVTAVGDAPVASDESASTTEDTSVVVDVAGNDSDVDGDLDPTTTSITAAPANGTATPGPFPGSVTYTPDADFNGSDSFTYEICDATALCDTALVSVSVTAANDAPAANDDSISTLEDTAVVVSVLANDTDVDGDPLSIDGFGQGGSGTVTDNGDGTVTYTPNANLTGIDSFTYTVTDGTDTSNTATVTVTVGVVNDAPVAADDAAGTAEDNAVTIDVVDNDTDVDGDALSVATVGAAANGLVVDNGDGTVTYTPDADFNGIDTFTYTVTDGTDTSNTATVTVTVTASNDAPVAADDTATTGEDTATTFDVVGNDTDVDGDALSVATVGAAANGLVVDNGDGTVTYTPDADFNGIDTFTYTVTDGVDSSNTATVTVTVTAVNDAPVAADDAATTAEDTAVTVDVFANDSDIDDDPFSVSSVGAAANGSVVDNGDGTLTYTPDPDSNGADSFTYTVSDGTATSNTASVSVTVSAVNDPPMAADDAAVTDEDVAVTIPFAVNDVDVDADPLTLDSITPAANGTLVDNGDGTVTYTPSVDFNGTDTFSYALSDGASTSNLATITVTVNPINDAPIAIDDSTATRSDRAVTVDVVANDVELDGEALTVIAVSQASNGTTTNNGDGTVTFRPNSSFSGTTTFSYTISDGGLTDTGLVTVAVTLANTPPIVSDLVTSVPETTSAGDRIGTVIATDPDGDGMVFTVSGDPRLQIGSGGGVTLVGLVDAGDLLQGTVTVTDANGASTKASITVTVTAVNSAPLISDQGFVVEMDAGLGSAVGSVSATDPDGDSLTFSIIGAAPFSIDSAGRLSVVGDLGSFGGSSVTFSVLVTDPDGQSAGALMTVSVRGLTPTNTTAAPTSTSTTSGENRPPVAGDDLVIGAEDTRIPFDPLVNDIDPDGDQLTVTWLVIPSEGEIVDSGGWWFVPRRDWNGTTTALYRIDDGRGGSVIGSITFVFNPVNDAPRIQTSTAPAKVSSGRSIEIPLPAIVDPENDSYTISIGDPEHGTAELVGSQIIYTPDVGHEGQDTIQLYIVDTAGAGTQAVFVIEVVIDGTTIAVTILDLGEIGTDPEGGGTGMAGGNPGGDGGRSGQFVLLGVPFFGLIASEVLSATWAVRAPLIAFVVVAAITLLATTRRSFSLTVKPLPVARSSDLTWSIVLVGEFERLPALSGPDHSNKAISWFDAGVTGIESTGNLMMTNGTLWVEVVTSAGRGWVEARHVTPGRPQPTDTAKDSLVAVRDALNDCIRYGEPYSHMVSGRGLYMQVGEEIASVPPSRVDPLLARILTDGEPESKQLVDALSMPVVKDDAYEVPVELRNFEHLVVGEGWNRWALYFERGTDGKPLLVGVSPARALVGA